MSGRLREICRGENIDPAKAAKYRANWAALAKDSRISIGSFDSIGLPELEQALTSPHNRPTLRLCG
jgi:hypothetical protein